MSTNNANEWNTLLRNGLNSLRNLGGNVATQGQQFLNATAQEIDDVLGQGASRLINQGRQAANEVRETVAEATQEVREATNNAKNKVTQAVEQGQKKVQDGAKKAARKGGVLGKIAGGTLAAAAIANDLNQAYNRGGMQGVVNALPGMVGTYGGGAVGLGLGTAAANALPIPNPAVRAGVTGLLGGTGAIAGALGGNTIANMITGNNTPEMTTTEAERIIQNYNPQTTDDVINAANAQIQEIDRIVNDTTDASSNPNQPLTQEQERILREDYGIDPNTAQAQPSSSGRSASSSVPVTGDSSNTTTPTNNQTVQNVPVTAGMQAVPQAMPVQTSQFIPYVAPAQVQSPTQAAFVDAVNNQTIRAINPQQVNYLLNTAFQQQMQTAGQNPYYQGNVVAPQGYYVDPEQLRIYQDIERFTNNMNVAQGRGVSPSELLQQQAVQTYRNNIANQAGVPYEDYVRGITAQQNAQTVDRVRMIEAMLDAQYRAAENDVERMRILGDMAKVEQQGINQINNQNAAGWNALQNTQLRGMYDMQQAALNAQNRVDVANLQGQYDAAIANMRLNDPSTQFRNIMSALQSVMFTNPQAAGALLQSLDPSITQALFRDNPQLLQTLLNGGATSYTPRQAGQIGLPSFSDFWNMMRGFDTVPGSGGNNNGQ